MTPLESYCRAQNADKPQNNFLGDFKVYLLLWIEKVFCFWILTREETFSLPGLRSGFRPGG